jgi:hypothetical protein
VRASVCGKSVMALGRETHAVIHARSTATRPRQREISRHPKAVQPVHPKIGAKWAHAAVERQIDDCGLIAMTEGAAPD